MDKKNIVTLVIICLISLLIGFVFGQFSEKVFNQEDKVQEELDWCKSEMEMFYPALPDEIYHFTGTVLEKEEGFLVIGGQVQISQFPLPNQEQFEAWNVKANLTDKTEIYQLEMTEELIIQEPTEEIIDPFQRKQLSLDDIKIGELVSVFSEENIKNKKEFTVSQVELFR